MFRGRDDELQSEDEDERSAADGGEEPGDEDDVSCFGSGCCRRVASSVEDLGGLGERGDLADSREVIGVLLIGPLMRCELAMQKRLKACKDPTLRLQATRTV